MGTLGARDNDGRLSPRASASELCQQPGQARRVGDGGLPELWTGAQAAHTTGSGANTS